MVQRLRNKGWGHGILTKQDKEFIYAINALTDLQMMCGNQYNGQKFATVYSYLETFGMPKDFKDRLELWDDFEDFLYDEGLLELIDG